MTTEIVNQRTDTDCVIASFSMWLKKPYEEVMDKAVELGVSPNKAGMTDDAEDTLGRGFGMKLARMRYYAGVEGILSVPSLNFPLKSHAVYVKNYKLHDPQTNRFGNKWYDLNSKTFPPCMNVTIDLCDEYSRDCFEGSIQMQQHVLNKALKEIEVENAS